jgi:hypothetical protein
MFKPCLLLSASCILIVKWRNQTCEMITPVFNLAKIALVANFGYRYDDVLK